MTIRIKAAWPFPRTRGFNIQLLAGLLMKELDLRLGQRNGLHFAA